MKVDAVRAKALVSQLQEVQQRIANVAKGQNVSFSCACMHHAPSPVQPQAKPSRLTSGALPLPRRQRSCDAGPHGRGSGPMWRERGREKKHRKPSQVQTTQKTDALRRLGWWPCRS